MIYRLRSFPAALVAAALLFAPAAARAQGAPGPMAMPSTPAAAPHHRARGMRYMRALHSLNLTAAQRGQIRTIVRNQRQALRTQIDGVLTPDQRTQLRANLTKPAGT